MRKPLMWKLSNEDIWNRFTSSFYIKKTWTCAPRFSINLILNYFSIYKNLIVIKSLKINLVHFFSALEIHRFLISFVGNID